MAAGAVLSLVRDGEEVVLGRLRCDRVDLAVVAALARLQLAAKRLGCSIRLDGAPDDLLELLDFVGVGALFGQPGRQSECREELRVQEVVDLDDPVA